MKVATRWYESLELADGVALLWEPHVHTFARCNIWYIRGRDRDLLIDSGSGLWPLLPSLPTTRPGHPVIAAATHAHFDHVGCHYQFGDCRAHEAEAEILETMRDEDTLAHLFRGLDDPVDALPGPGWDQHSYRLTPASVTARLADGDRIDLGDRVFIVVHLPGHSPGSVGFFEERTGILFSGDALYDGELIDNFQHSDVAAYRTTMERLQSLEISIGHGGHCGSFNDARKSVLIADYLAGRRYQGCPIDSAP